MARQKGKTARKGNRDDMITVPYGHVVFYVIIGLIIGMAIGALALLYVARVQNDYEQSLNSTSGQLLRSTGRY